MSKGFDTMVRENSRDEVTVSDGLQLGRSTVDQSDVRSAEDEVNDLRHQVAEVSVATQPVVYQALREIGFSSMGCPESKDMSFTFLQKP